MTSNERDRTARQQTTKIPSALLSFWWRPHRINLELCSLRLCC